MHGHLDRSVVALGLEIDGAVERFLPLVQIRHEVDDAAGVLERLAPRLAIVIKLALIGQLDMQALVEECHLAEAIGKRVVVVHRGVGENLGVGPERGLGARAIGVADALEFFHGLSALECDGIQAAVALHFYLHAGRKRIHAGNAYAVQAAGYLIALAAELTAGMQDGQNDLYRGHFFFGVLIDGNAAAVVGNRDGIILMDGHVDFGAEPRKGLVDGIIHDLVHQVMQAARACGADVHAGAFADGLQAFKHLDVRAIVVAGFFLGHVLPPSSTRPTPMRRYGFSRETPPPLRSFSRLKTDMNDVIFEARTALESRCGRQF